VHVADELRDIEIGLLHEPKRILRPVVKDSVEYLERKDSIEHDGFINPICVRPSSRQPGKFEIVDGMWRFTAACDLKLTTIPCIIKHGLTDQDALALQIKGNAVLAETKPIEYSRHLRRILEYDPSMTFAELARKVGKNSTWVKDRLGLLFLAKDIQLMVDRGEIPVGSAYMLAKIPPRLRREYVNEARALPTHRFKMLAASVVKQFKECVHQGKMDDRYLPEFRPQPHLRGVKEFKDELEDPKVGATLIAANGCKTLLDAWNLCLVWALHLDAESLEEQRAAYIKRETTKFISREDSNEALDD
jgi:ParB/RepB/Spo0J family partition protein